MPDFLVQKPHVITCIKKSIRDTLAHFGDREITVTCDRSDCWNDKELFKYRQAINLRIESDNAISPSKGPQGGKRTLGQPALDTCMYDALLNLQMSIYVEDCHGDDECLVGIDKALSILGHMTPILVGNPSSFGVRRIVYQGSDYELDSDNELNIAVLNARFNVEFLFDPARPWVLTNTNTGA